YTSKYLAIKRFTKYI
uniref:Uncharacterized protein n=1 Tax=Bursaphelenchus xylophilus TaxID=6326 RepID=A0A1I7SI36_BURXY